MYHSKVLFRQKSFKIRGNIYTTHTNHNKYYHRFCGDKVLIYLNLRYIEMSKNYMETLRIEFLRIFITVHLRKGFTKMILYHNLNLDSQAKYNQLGV